VSATEPPSDSVEPFDPPLTDEEWEPFAAAVGIDPPFNTRRAVQTSLLPELQPDKPIGPILPSVITGKNADLIHAVAPYYLTGSVCDVTYGRGMWWLRFRPSSFVAHDLDPTRGDGVDFTALPEPDDTYDAVCFDPPYIAPGGSATSTLGKPRGPGRGGRMRDGFALVQRSHAELWDLIDKGVTECVRVLRPGGFLLAKCMDVTEGQALDLGHRRVIEMAEGHGMIVHETAIARINQLLKDQAALPPPAAVGA